MIQIIIFNQMYGMAMIDCQPCCDQRLEALI